MEDKYWTAIVKPKTGWFDIDLNEVFQYRDLIKMFIKRDFKTMYKQTILGPLWIIISPLFTTLMFTIVFGKIANISTDGIPQFLFYMSGNIIWSYFSTVLSKTSNTFISNVSIFGKVYFPRLVMPISVSISSLINFGVQFFMFIGFLIYFYIKGSSISPNWYMLLSPLLIIQSCILALGFGIIISSLTTKYRDLAVLVGFGLQLWMYATPIVYPVSQISNKYKNIVLLNPMAPIIETFRFVFLGCGEVPIFYLIISMLITLLVLIIGIVLFNKIEKNFMDTV